MIIGSYWLNVVLAFDVTRKPFPDKPAENENRIAVFNFRFPWETEVDFNFVGLGSSCFANRLRWRKKIYKCSIIVIGKLDMNCTSEPALKIPVNFTLVYIDSAEAKGVKEFLHSKLKLILTIDSFQTFARKRGHPSSMLRNLIFVWR